jgi:hypothetical protein
MEHPHFSMRHLIVAGSRVTHGQYLHTMRPAQQQRFKLTCEVTALQTEVGLANAPREPFVAVAVDEPWAFGDEW